MDAHLRRMPSLPAGANTAAAAQHDFSTATTAAAARDPADAARNTCDNGGKPAGTGARGGLATDVGAAAVTALAPRPAADGALAARDTDGDSPFDGAGAPDYAATDNGKPADGGDAGWAVGAGGSYQGYRGRAPRVTNDEAGAYDEGIDFKASFTPTDWLQSFYIRRLALREDGLPVPFTPVDSVQTATVHIGSRDKVEARHWYCSLAWRQQIFNDCLDARFTRGNTVASLELFINHLVEATRRVYALGVSLYDYLALRRSEPSLADAFANSEAVLWNSLRGDGARRFLSRAEAQACLRRPGASVRGPTSRPSALAADWRLAMGLGYGRAWRQDHLDGDTDAV
ncbi:hypothetical protein I4F81_000458 [Pyropia yezoensis]|uniref:Uncharacterized protein n=1 Tax=Pyropia yezoensis TaxID=2788 RepID=A0ACC3BJA4_PYRYE|nr:hypothetical protein I4F81_000458 [Neopyropia yezoensis]